MPPPPPGGIGRHVSGGGTIPGSAGDARCGINVFQTLKGKIDYEDGTAADFHTTRILSVSFNDPVHSVQITGEGLDGDQRVTFTVNAVDNGEAGTSDQFSISLSDGYNRSGTLTSGNIQFN